MIINVENGAIVSQCGVNCAWDARQGAESKKMCQLQRLQHVPNIAARIVTQTKKRDHVTPCSVERTPLAPCWAQHQPQTSLPHLLQYPWTCPSVPSCLS